MTEPADAYVLTLTDVGAVLSALVALAAVLAYRRWRWTS